MNIKLRRPRRYKEFWLWNRANYVIRLTENNNFVNINIKKTLLKII